jgi:DNA polymerase III epsilon subunit-like protein
MKPITFDEAYISVDVETAGPNPSQYSLLSIGACTVWQPQSNFYVELQPINEDMRSEAFAIHGLTIEALRENGTAPGEAMSQFETWLKEVVPVGQHPIFVAFNAPFDWMFVSDYFHRYLGHNPFGHAALDILSTYWTVGKSAIMLWRTRSTKRRFLSDYWKKAENDRYCNKTF